LVDSHLHLGIGNLSDLTEQMRNCLNAGLAGIRDGGDREAATLRNKQRLAGMGLEIRAAGWAIGRRGGYGAFLGRGVREWEEFREALSHLVRLGADVLKIILTGVVDFSTGGLSEPHGFDACELKRMVDAAGESGLRVMAHANADTGVGLAVEAGVQSIEHGYLCTKESFRRMADGGVYWVPTLLPVFRLGESRTFRATHPVATLKNLRRIYGRQEENVALAHEMGVRVAAGTDAGAPGVQPGPSLHEEIRLLVRAGLSWDAALRAGTLHSGELASREGGAALGCLAPGSKAHLLALSRSASSGPWGMREVRFVLAVQPASAPDPGVG
jgi:imidazolonepropionase-like amidohydrolase